MLQRFRLILVLALLPCISVIAAPMPQNQPQRGDEDRAKLLGLLINTTITARFDRVPVRDVFDAISRATDVSIVGRWGEEGDGFAFDPSREITLKVEDRRALDVIEDVLDQAAEYEDLTWQLRRGYVEVGTKARLSVPGARETRTYHIRDLMIEAPRFSTRGEHTPVLGSYGAAYIGIPAPLTSYGRRKMPEELGIEIVESISEIVEPGRWDYGQDDPPKDGDSPPSPAPADAGAAPAKPAPADGSQLNKNAPEKLSDRMRYWGSIRFWRESMIVRAPDFMHRQINGYPAPPRGTQRHITIPDITSSKANAKPAETQTPPSDVPATAPARN